MKMKKIVSIAVSAALLVSMAATAAFAVESTASPSASDADAGETTVSTSGESAGLTVDVSATAESSEEEQKLQSEGMEGYFGNAAVDAAAAMLNTTSSNLTVSGLKQLSVDGYKTNMGSATLDVPFAALPKAGTQVSVIVRVETANGNVVNLPVNGVVVEDVVENSVSVVRKVRFTLDSVTMQNIQAGNAYVAVVTTK